MTTMFQKWNMSKIAEQLKPKTFTSVNQIGSEEPSPPIEPPASPVPDWANFQANMERMIAAAMAKNDRGRPNNRTPQGSRSGSRDSRDGQRSRNIPNPRFKGYWCCGEEGHSNQTCSKFLAIKEKNGGKVPADYEGAYEKAMKKSKNTVGALTVKSDADTEHKETMIWPLLTDPRVPEAPAFKPTPTKNSFSSLADGTDDDDESEVMKALAQLTSHVMRASGKSQSQKRSKSKYKFTLAKIQSLAKQLRDGELNLPDLELDSNEEYDCVWALVDSGAGVNCACKEQFPNAVPVEAPEVLLSTASGDTLPNSGAMKVATMSKEGVTRERVFYNAPVEIPILSIAEVSQEGPAGSDAKFRRTDGFIEDNKTHERQHFVKRKGVYFMKLYVEKNKTNGFGRLGSHP